MWMYFILDIEDEDKYLAVNDDPTSNLILEAIKNDELRKVKKILGGRGP